MAEPWTNEQFIAQFVALQNEVNFLNEQMQNAAQAPAAAGAAPAPRIKFNKPDEFTGDTALVDTFLRQCRTYFLTFPTMNDESKILFALSYLKGPIAGRWADRQHDAIQGGEAEALTEWEGEGGFVEVFKDVFGDPDRQATARHRLALIKQGTKTAEQFIIDFEILEADANLGDGALIEHFKKALQRRLVERIYSLETLPTELREWKDYARRFDRHQRQYLEWEAQTRLSMPIVRPRPAVRTDFQQRRPPFGQQLNTFRPRFNAFNFAGNRAQDPMPMEVDRAQRLGGNRGPRPLVCWKCGGEGHRQNECPNQGRVGASGRTVQVIEEEARNGGMEGEGNTQDFGNDQAGQA